MSEGPSLLKFIALIFLRCSSLMISLERTSLPTMKSKGEMGSLGSSLLKVEKNYGDSH